MYSSTSTSKPDPRRVPPTSVAPQKPRDAVEYLNTVVKKAMPAAKTKRYGN